MNAGNSHFPPTSFFCIFSQMSLLTSSLLKSNPQQKIHLFHHPILLRLPLVSPKTYLFSRGHQIQIQLEKITNTISILQYHHTQHTTTTNHNALQLCFGDTRNS